MRFFKKIKEGYTEGKGTNMKTNEETFSMLRSVNTSVCWVVQAPFYIKMKGGKRRKTIKTGFAKQTPALYDQDKVRIVALNGPCRKFILEGKNVQGLYTLDGNQFW